MQYSVLDPYAEYQYQIKGVDESGENRVESKKISYINVQRVEEDIVKDTSWGGNVGIYEVAKYIELDYFTDLYVSPGVKIYILKGAGLTINGNMYLEGEEDSKISINVFSETGDENICITPNGRVEARYTKFDYIYSGDEEYKLNFRRGSILVCGSLSMQDCEVKSNSPCHMITLDIRGYLWVKSTYLSSEKGYVVNAIDGTVGIVIEDCIIENNNICVSSDTLYRLVFKNNSVQNCNSQLSAGLIIYLYGKEEFEISGNVFDNTGEYPIYICVKQIYKKSGLDGIYNNVYKNHIKKDMISLYVCLEGDMVFPQKDKYIIGGMSIERGAKLIVPAGTKMLMESERRINIYGTLELKGTEEQPIEISSEKYWEGIYVFSTGELLGEHVNLNHFYVPRSYSIYEQKLEVAMKISGKTYLEDCIIDGDADILFSVGNTGELVLENTGIIGGTYRCISIEGEQNMFTMLNCVVESDALNTIYIDQKKLSSLRMENNKVYKVCEGSSNSFCLYFETMENEDSIILNNEFSGSSGYPIYINLEGIRKENIIQEIRENKFLGFSENEGCVLNGNAVNDIRLPEGKYVAQQIGCYEGACVTVDPGTEIIMRKKSEINIHGDLLLNGTEDKEVTICGETENVGSILVGDYGRVCATWVEINIGGSSSSDSKGIITIDGGGHFGGKNVNVKLNSTSVTNIGICVFGTFCLEEGQVVGNNRKAICLKDTGTVFLEDISISNGGQVPIYAEGNNCNLQVRKCKLQCLAGGTCVYACQSGNSSLILVENEFCNSSNYGVYVEGAGVGEFEITDNFFDSTGLYPIDINLSGFVNKEGLCAISNNTYQGHSFSDMIALEGKVCEDISLLSGESYLVRALTVLEGGTLAVPKGTKLYMSISSSIAVYGTLKLLGETDNNVEIITHERSWSGLSVKPNGHVRAEYTNIDIIGGYNKKGICVEGKLELSDCCVSGTVDTLIFLEGGGELELLRVEIGGGKDKAIGVYGANSILSLKECEIQCGNTYGIYIEQTGVSSCEISNNTLTGDESLYGIYVKSLGIGEFEVSNNILPECVYHPLIIDMASFVSGKEVLGISGNVFTEGRYYGDFLLTGDVVNNICLPKGKYVCQTISVAKDRTFNVEAGTEFLFYSDCRMYVKGELYVNGTQQENVVFTTVKDEQYMDNGNAVLTPSWQGVYLYEGGKCNINYSVFRYAQNAIVLRGKANIINSEFMYSSQNAIYVDSAITPVINYCSFIENECALYNYREDVVVDAQYNYWGDIEGPSRYEDSEWVGNGEKIEGNINWSSPLGSEMRTDMALGRTEGAYAATGNYAIKETDLSYPCLDGTMEFIRTYNSLKLDETSAFGNGWDFNYACKSYISDKYGEEYLFVQIPDGREDYFKEVNGTWVSQSTRNTITRAEDGSVELITPEYVTYYYNCSGALEKICDEQGNSIIIKVEVPGEPTAITDCVGRTTNVAYKEGRLSSIIDFAGRKVSYLYDEDGRLTSVIGVDGSTTSYRYEGGAEYGISEVINHEGEVVEELEYVKKNRQWRISSVKDANGKLKTYSYDDEHRATIITYGDGSEEIHYYDSSYNVIGITNTSGENIYYGYRTDDNGSTKYGELQSERDAMGNYTLYERDAKGNVLKITYPDLGIEEFKYDEYNHCIYHKDQVGVITRFEYDEKGLLLREIVELSKTSYSPDAGSMLFAITTYTYYEEGETQCLFNGLIKSITTPEGVVTSFDYDEYGNRTSMTDGLNHTVSYEYNKYGQMTKQITAEGYETDFEYDVAGRLRKTILHEGETTEVRYNFQGLPIMEILPEGNEQSSYQYRYDKAGNLLEKEDPKGNITEFEYDIFGNKVYEKIPSEAEYYYEYDKKNRLTCVSVKKSSDSMKYKTKEYTYTIGGGKLKVEETVYTGHLSGNTTTYWYDENDRLVEQKNPDGGILKWSYRKDGMLESETDVFGNTTYYGYDAQKNCTQIWKPLGDSLYAYSYNKYTRDGMISVRRKSEIPVEKDEIPKTYSEIIYSYDRCGRISKVIDEAGVETSYVYDKDNRCISEIVEISENERNLKTYTYGHLNDPLTMSIYVGAENIVGNVELDEETGLAKLTTHYVYDAEARLVREIAPDGTETSYKYNVLGQCVEITITEKNGESKKESREYDEAGRIKKETDANGNETIYEYDSIGNLIKIKDALGGIRLFAYDYAGNKKAEVSAKNFESYKEISELTRLEYVYDYAGRVIEVWEVLVDETGYVSTLILGNTYDMNGRLITEADANGNEIHYSYNCAGYLEEVLTPEAAEAGETYAIKYSYDALGQVVTEKNVLGGTITYTYDKKGNVSSVTKTLPGEEPYTVYYEYTVAGNTKKKWATDVFSDGYIYNEAEWIIRDTDGPSGYYEKYYYDVVGQPVSIDNAMGALTKLQYDSFGNVLKRSVSDTNGEYYRVEKYTYDLNGNIRSYTDEEGVTTTYDYDALNREVSRTIVVSGKEQTLTTEYDANGNVTAKIDAFGNKTSYFYDAFDRLTMVVSPDGIVQVSYLYDSAGNCKEQKDGLGNVTKYEYNGAGKVTKTTDAEGNTTLQKYDAMGNLASVTDGAENTTSYEYDGFGNLVSVTTEDGIETEYVYDIRGNMIAQIDGENNITKYTYNGDNLLLKKQEDQTVVASYTYNKDGSVKSMTDANGTTNTYEYNVHGELVSETAVGKSWTKSVYTYEYDWTGNLLSMTDESGTTTYEYDELGRVTEKIVPRFGKVTYTYNLTDGMKNGYHYELQTDETGTTKTVYDTLNRVVEITTQNMGGEADTVEISYYDNGARKQVTYGDGSRESYTYYGNNLVKSVINRLADDTVVDVFTYVYDGAGNLKKKTERTNGVERGATIYTYDQQNRLESVTEPDGTVISYTYDKAGNRETETTKDAETGAETVKTYTYNGRNQLLNVVQTVDGVNAIKTAYTYDANGNQLSEKQTTYAVATESGKDETVTVLENIYDLRNQLVCSETADATIVNTYNASGYRVAKNVTKGGDTSKTYFLYDGNNVIMEADENGVTAKNTYGGPLLLRTEFNGTDEITYEYLYNAHGDVVTLISDGEVAATYYYDSFGNILEQIGDVSNSILYAGYQYDEETGLYYINARMYDPVTARFLQADTYLGNTNDPLSLNLYTYCLNNPHKYVDPSGHIAIATVLLIAKIGIWLASGIISAKAEYDRQIAEGDNYTDWKSVLFVGAANAGISFWSFGVGQGAVAVAGAGAKAVLKHVGKAVVRDAAIGVLTDAGIETARQLVTGTRITNLEYDRIAEAGVVGGIVGGASTIAGAGLEGLMKTRVAQKALAKVNLAANKGWDAIKKSFKDFAADNRGMVDLDAYIPKWKRVAESNDNIVFYHGTSTLGADSIYRNGVDLKYATRDMDFGRGFYVTTDLEQAMAWASRHGDDGGAVVKFEIPKNVFEGMNNKTFNSASMEWEEFVVNSRKGMMNSFDTVSGPMLANPKVAVSGKKTPIAIGQQTAFNSKKAVRLLNKYMIRR